MEQKVTVKEYPPEMSGERVGWVSVIAPPERDDIVTVGLAVASVGDEGATYGYREARHGDELIRFPDDEGFVAVSSLFMIVAREGGTDPSSQFYFSSNKDDGKASSIMHTAGGYGSMTPKDADKVWCDSTDGLLDTLKEGLQLNELSGYYPDVYYGLNLRIGADKNLGRDVVERGKYMLADPKMSETTSKEMAEALRIAKLIDEVIDMDQLMLQELTVFSSLRADQVPDVFANARRMVAANERLVLRTVDGLHSILAVYRPDGRTWPYMDPLATDEEQSFGYLLRDFQHRSVDRPRYELEKEIYEARKRLEYAKQGAGLLGTLAVAESEKVRTAVGGC